MSASDASFDSGTEGVTATLTATQFNALSQGSHTIYVHGKDQLGNWGATASVSFVKDTVGPTVTIDHIGQADPTSGSTITFTAHFSEVVAGTSRAAT